MIAPISGWEAETVIGLPMASAMHALDWTAYQADQGEVWAARWVPGPIPGPSTVDLLFCACELRRERFGTFAKLVLQLDDRPLTWEVINLDQARDRQRLATAAHAALHPTMRSRYSRDQLSADLDRFCYGLAAAWERLLGRSLDRGGIKV